MAITLSGNAKASIQASYTDSTSFWGALPRPVQRALQFAFTSGTAADMADRAAFVTKALTASTPDTINLKSLTDPNGATFTDMARVRCLILWNESTTDAAYTIVGADTTNGWSGGFVNSAAGEGVIVRASTTANVAVLMLTAPNTTAYAVGASNRVILLTPTAHNQTIKAIILGASA
jgi:hypothetical protein